VNLPFWTVEYVGAGPYRLERWEPGAFIEAAAFDGHALGRPKISRIRLQFSSDANAAAAVLMSGEAQMAIDDAVGLEQGVVLKQDWEARGAGTVSYIPSIARYVRVQYRPEYARSQAILDPAVRKALAHTIDKQLINENVFYGAALRSDTMLPPTITREVPIDIPIYAYDPRRAEQLLQGAGYAKDRDGFYVAPNEGRMNLELKNITSNRNDAERTILANAWRQLGIEIDEATFRPAEARDGQALSTFRSLSPTGGVTGDDRFLYFLGANITSAENNWVGSNRGAWSNPAYDRLIDRWNDTLEEADRASLLAQAARVLNDELAVIPLYYAPSVFAFASNLRGLDMRTPTAEPNWNMHLWELR
jgi:peptide/nickel transport system substrate-binding protein